MHRFATYVTLFLVVLAVGCDSGGKPGDSAAPGGSDSPTAQGGVIRFPADKLPEVGAPMPPLEGGTLEMARPKGWQSLPRNDQKYVCGFIAEKGQQLPRLVLTSQPNPVTSITRVTEENVEQFTKLTAERLAKTAGDNLTEPPLAMIVGDKPCTRYVLLTEFGEGSGVASEQQILETIHNGKLYKFSLAVFAGGIKAHRDQAYAVFASMNFTEEAPAAQPATEADAPETVPPAEADTPEAEATPDDAAAEATDS